MQSYQQKFPQEETQDTVEHTTTRKIDPLVCPHSAEWDILEDVSVPFHSQEFDKGHKDRASI